jgi:hypothetical protein
VYESFSKRLIQDVYEDLSVSRETFSIPTTHVSSTYEDFLSPRSHLAFFEKSEREKRYYTHHDRSDHKK